MRKYEFDAAKTKDEIVEWIRNYFRKNGPDCNAVIGISGGKDSSIVDASCCAGVTPESHKNALAAMKMCQIEIVNEEK